MELNKFPYGIKLFDIVLNKKCNAKCNYCRILSQGGGFKDIEMSEQVLMEFYQKLLNNPPKGEQYYCINYDETEPLFSFDLVKKMFELFPIERANRFFHSFTTNGILLDKEKLDFCEKHDIVVKISTDGTPKNCFEQKGVDILKIVDLCKSVKKKQLICFSYVISKSRIKFLEQDLAAVYDYYLIAGGEWSFLINTVEEWEENEYQQLIKRIENFLWRHYNKKSHYLFSEEWHFGTETGIKIDIDGQLELWPRNKSCRYPIDKDFINLGKDCGTIFLPNENKIKSFLDKYGLNFSKTYCIGQSCKDCVCYQDCHPSTGVAPFHFALGDCQNHRFHTTLRRDIMGQTMNYSKIKQDFRLEGVCLNLTNQCNMACKYCFTKPNFEKISLDTAKSAIMWIKSNQGDVTNTHINFFGGEPMLMYDEIMVPLITWVEKMGIEKITFGMTTNGTLFTKERIDWLADHNVSILLSIDGGPKTQNTNRILKNNGDSFLAVAENLPYLLARNPYITFRSTLTPENIDEMVENYLWAKELGFQSFYIMPNEFEEWTFEQLKKMAGQLRSLYWEMYTNISKGESTPTFSFFFRELFGLFGLKRVSPEKPFLRCGLGTTSVGIGVNGEIFGCQEHNTYDTSSPFYLGNIFKDGIEEDRREALIAMYLTNLPEGYNACPSHCFGVNNDLTLTSEVHKVWSGTTKSTIAEILLDAETTNNTKFIEFIENKGRELI